MRKFGLWAVLAIVLSFTSCVSNKDMTYLQGVEKEYAKYKDMTTTYSLKIGADDQLAISITSRDNKLISIFNNQTLIGSAEMLIQTNSDPDALIRMVASPKGTTEAALKSFELRIFLRPARRLSAWCRCVCPQPPPFA